MTKRRMPTRFCALALLLVLACTRGKEEAAPHPPAADTLQRNGQHSAASETWMVTESGAGPLRVGMSLAQAIQAMGEQLQTPVASEPCYYIHPSNAPPGLSFMIVDGRIVRVDVRDSSAATSLGARVGDSEEQIKALYGSRVQVTPHKYMEGHYLTIKSEDGRSQIIFETDGRKVTRYRAGVLPAVAWVEGCS